MIEELTESWLRQRIGKFTSSEVGRLLETSRGGEGFGKTALSYIRKKLAENVTGQTVSLTSIDSLEWGNQFEGEAIEQYEMKTGNSVIYYGKLNPEFIEYSDYFGGSPDGLVGEDGLVEVKCPYNSSVHINNLLMDDLTIIDSDYYPQIQANLLVTEREWLDFISYDPRMANNFLRLKVIRVERNEDYIEAMKDRIAQATVILKDMYTKLMESETNFKTY